MVINDSRRFDEFAKSCGNKYLAVRVIAKWARDLGEKFNEYNISESKLLEIVLNGKWYYSEYEMMQRKTVNDADHIQDFLEWVMDDSVVEEVKYLYQKSVKNKGLQLCTNPYFTQGQRSKTNILLRMIWYSTDK